MSLNLLVYTKYLVKSCLKVFDKWVEIKPSVEFKTVKFLFLKCRHTKLKLKVLLKQKKKQVLQCMNHLDETLRKSTLLTCG